MAVAQLNTSTLSEDLSKDATEVAVGSTANVSVGQWLVICGTAGKEAVKVQEIPVSGRVKIIRGQGGTNALSHKSGATFYIGAQDTFITIRNSSPNQYISLTGSPGTGVIDYALPGSRARDGAGNEYVMLDLTFSAFRGVAVLISRDGLYTAKALAAGDVGSVAIMAEEATSAQYAWGQIYGAFPAAQFTSGSSLATSTGLIEAATTASTPAGGLLGRTTSQASSAAFERVLGLYLTSAVTTGTTAATSATGFVGSVWLNYPTLENNITSA